MEAQQFLPSSVQSQGAAAAVLPQAQAPQPVAYQPPVAAAPPVYAAPPAVAAPPTFAAQSAAAAYAPPQAAYQAAPPAVAPQPTYQAPVQQTEYTPVTAAAPLPQYVAPTQLQTPPAAYVPPAVTPAAPPVWEQAADLYSQPAPQQYQPASFDQASYPPADPAQPAYQRTQAPTDFQQPAPLASRTEFTPLPSPVVFEAEAAEMVAADIFSSGQASPAALPPVVRQQVAPEFEMSRDASLRPDLDLDAALQMVLDLGASDLHIAVNATPMIRIDGGLRPLDGAPVWNELKVSSALKSILSPAQLAIYEEALEFDFAYTLSSQARFRVNFYQQRDNMGAAFRLIPTGIKSLKELGVPDTIAEFAKLPRGLVLITGPTGSGKSTTLAGLIDIVNRTRADHIMTVEDPIEFLHVNHKSLINQREVGHDTHSFAAALKHVLRQDPDVILVGELRDLETISVALTAAETGHLVFATLHTSDAPQTIDRIIDVYPPHQQAQVRAQLSATLQGVVCQTLIKKASGRGRVVATEVLVRTSAVANLIREGKTFQIHSAMQAGRELGMHTIDQHLADLVTTGQITLEAAKEKTHDLETLERLISGSRAPTTNSNTNMAESMSYQGQQ